MPTRHKLKTLRWTLTAFACAASPAPALTGAGPAEPRLGLAAAGGEAGASDEAFVATLQTPEPETGGGGLGLTAGRALLGRYGLSAEAVLAEVAPHLTRCKLELVDVTAHGTSVHEIYALTFGGYPLLGARLSLHHNRNKLVMVRAQLPSYRLPETAPVAGDFLGVETLGYAAAGDGGTRQSSQRVIAQSGGFPAPAWRLVTTRRDELTGTSVTETVIDAQTGASLAETALGFDLAHVYEHGPQDGALTTVELEGLPGTGYLDGEHFAVYAPGEADPRVMAPDLAFDFLPDDPADALNFDQVQAYYGATKGLRWFRERFGYDIGPTRLTVRVGAVVEGRADNAQYLPLPGAPEIQIGRGNDVLQNLARDTDVVVHEFSHHIIYQYVPSKLGGDAAVLHEGTADYFAYAVNGDPYLAESIVVGGGALRTAALDPKERWDEVDQKKPAHTRGQIWSAALWQLRTALGPEADDLVYQALPYLGPGATVRDGFLALLNADRDRHPLPDGDPEAGVFGAHKCLILDVAVARGFAGSLGDIDGLSCGLDMGTLSTDSRIRSGDLRPEAQGRSIGVSVFGRTCAVVAEARGAPRATRLLWLALLALPALTPLLILARAKPGSRGT
jgi:hypothetical protein